MKNQIDRIEKLSRDNYGLISGFRVNPSSCGNPQHYEQYIRFCASDDHRLGKGTTFLFIRTGEQGDAALGYITLRAASYIQESNGVTYGSPALEIAELAVCESAERLGIGTELLKFASVLAYELNDDFLGIEYIVLCADEQAVPFYQKFNFGRISDIGEIPRDGWNDGCVPMVLRIAETKM